MFPLIEGLPVALTDHVDRNPGKQLLRGKTGVIHSWKCSATEDSVWEDDVRILHEFPEVVYVKFGNCSWHIEGRNLYILASWHQLGCLAAGLPPTPPPCCWLLSCFVGDYRCLAPTSRLAALLVITGAWLLLCSFIAALGYQNIFILGGFGIMKT